MEDVEALSEPAVQAAARLQAAAAEAAALKPFLRELIGMRVVESHLDLRRGAAPNTYVVRWQGMGCQCELLVVLPAESAGTSAPEPEARVSQATLAVPADL